MQKWTRKLAMQNAKRSKDVSCARLLYNISAQRTSKIANCIALVRRRFESVLKLWSFHIAAHCWWWKQCIGWCQNAQQLRRRCTILRLCKCIWCGAHAINYLFQCASAGAHPRNLLRLMLNCRGSWCETCWKIGSTEYKVKRNCTNRIFPRAHSRSICRKNG